MISDAGIHIGDVVVEEGGDVFGDGVNVASRIENLAEPGGICISERVYHDIRNKPVLQVAYLGEKTLKNVNYPIKVFSLVRGETSPPVPKPEKELILQNQVQVRHRRLLPAGIAVIVMIAGYTLYTHFAHREVTAPEAPSPETIAQDREKTEEKTPLIAVLPFVDMSPEKDQEWFCDGISEEIINRLTMIRSLKVISRNEQSQMG